MVPFYILLIASCIAFVAGDGITVSAEDQKAIEDRLSKLQAIEDFLKLIFKDGKLPEAREEKCLPLYAKCSVFSGPNCCGLRTRCFYFKGDCREYNLGVALDEIGKALG